jgi:hypothetical protein
VIATVGPDTTIAPRGEVLLLKRYRVARRLQPPVPFAIRRSVIEEAEALSGRTSPLV